MAPSVKQDEKLHSHIEDLRGTSRLAIEATQGVCDLIEAMHETVAKGPYLLGNPLQRPTRTINQMVYGSIRCVTNLVGASIDGVLGRLTRLIGPGHRVSRSSQEDAVLAVLNGVLGDYLQETGNPLAIPMQLRHTGAPLVLEPKALHAALPKAGPKLLLLVHGSCLSDRQWSRQGHDHGAELARDLGYTPIYLHYNTGLHISTNGRTLATLLDQLVTAWPVPLEEIAILSHSMGGLVARSACHIAEEQNYLWRRKLRVAIFLGTPHQGAPLERVGNWIDHLLVINRYSAPFARLGKIRSAGVTDMRHGNVLDEHWQGRDRFAHGRDTRTPLPLPTNISCYTIAATKGPKGTGKLRSDGIVPVNSALGMHKLAKHSLVFPETHQWIAYGTSHLDLLNRHEVYTTVRKWLEAPKPASLPSG
ncbi:MAG: alpha/beta hydrolase [Bdellovibrionia bacterium]